MATQYSKIRSLQRKADKLWKQKIFEKYGKLCTVCGKIAADPHHCFPKGSFSNLRYDLDNGTPLCRNHHMAIHYRSDPSVMVKIIEKRGKEWYDKLEAKSKEPTKSWKSEAYYQEIIKSLQYDQ